MKTLVVGRSPFADVVIADPAVAPHHAELVLTDEGRIHLTDCGTPTGTWRKAQGGSPAGPDWERVRQRFVGENDELKIGEHLCTAAEIVRLAKAREGSERGEGGVVGLGVAPAAAAVSGRVQRDPVTGEIVRRRF